MGKNIHSTEMLELLKKIVENERILKRYNLHGVSGVGETILKKIKDLVKKAEGGSE
tara:strand:- start:437 stop:604 length:168 start_codon:yes stop_codon:yes gene_type:complete